MNIRAKTKNKNFWNFVAIFSLSIFLLGTFGHKVYANNVTRSRACKKGSKYNVDTALVAPENVGYQVVESNNDGSRLPFDAVEINIYEPKTGMTFYERYKHPSSGAKDEWGPPYVGEDVFRELKRADNSATYNGVLLSIRLNCLKERDEHRYYETGLLKLSDKPDPNSISPVTLNKRIQKLTKDLEAANQAIETLSKKFEAKLRSSSDNKKSDDEFIESKSSGPGSHHLNSALSEK